MKRVISIIVVLALALAACSSLAAPTTTSPSTTSSSTTTSSTTTTTAPTTTTTVYSLALEGAGEALTEFMTTLYSGEADPESFPAPRQVVEAFAQAESKPPLEGRASVAAWDEKVRLGVVQVGNDVTLLVADPKWRVVGGWWPSVKGGTHLGEFPKIVAVVGSDARPRERRDETRSDSIHFVGIDGKGNAGIVGVPRDSWVSIPGWGRSKINAALSFGGPQLMMETFTDLTGLDFDGFLLTGFAGFEGLIEVLGGLEIDVPRRFNDSAAKADIQPGPQVLDPKQTLAMARTRKTLPRGDFDRQYHGGLILMAAQAMLKARGPLALPDLLARARPHVSTNFWPGELLVLAASVLRVDPAKVVNTVAPGGTGSAGGASVVFLSDSASSLWEDLADGSLEAPD
jgi:LCP family protein required for cell wall assembly